VATDLRNQAKLPRAVQIQESNATMNKKEINSPKLTANFLFWVAGVGGVLLLALLHYVWEVF
jgi:hypothetical protein